MLNDDVKIKLLKVYALSISGIAGEMKTAAKLLDSLLKKHEVSLEDVLKSEKPIVGRLYDYSNEYELHLMIQLLETKFHERHSFYIVPENQQLSVSLSESNHIVFDFLFGVYRRAMEKELRKSVKRNGDTMTSFTAFISENRLFTPTCQNDEKSRATKISKRFISKYKDMKIVPIYNPTSTRKDYEN